LMEAQAGWRLYPTVRAIEMVSEHARSHDPRFWFPSITVASQVAIAPQELANENVCLPPNPPRGAPRRS